MSLDFDPAYNWSMLRDAIDNTEPSTAIEHYLQTLARCMLTIAESEELKMALLHAQLDGSLVEEEDESGEEE